jgi:hypothetical protein
MEAIPSTPIRRTAPTIIRTIFTALFPDAGAAGGGVVATGEGAGEAAEVTGADARTKAPHLLQKRVPGVRVEPQELQKAILTSMDMSLADGREYSRDCLRAKD